MTDLERTELYTRLARTMEEFLIEEDNEQTGIGTVPGNTESLMADGAYAVLESIMDTAEFIEDNKKTKKKMTSKEITEIKITCLNLAINVKTSLINKEDDVKEKTVIEIAKEYESYVLSQDAK